MIIGKDKERVMLIFIKTVFPPYQKRYHDIGHCSGWLSEERRHKG